MFLRHTLLFIHLDFSSSDQLFNALSQSTTMNSFSVYCLLLCSLLIFVVHQSNAARIPVSDDAAAAAVVDESGDDDGNSVAAASAVSRSRATVDVQAKPRPRPRPSSVQCANGQITITNGKIECNQ
ncbi:unnamed protein product [Adineta ricciae]|uniref:Uncharacterized protein n=1 Tax=Adineta ricciae TaxID=249248 RepID=A0A815JNJ8_ADIRI|nr:unnamed protein product [Adineta ricciae]